MNVTIIQTELHWENSAKNISHFTALLEKARNDSDIIVLPEMFTTGFSMNAKTYAEASDGVSVQWLKEKAKERNCAITGSIMIKENDRFYNRLFWVDADQMITYDKRHLFSYAKEDETYTAGTQKKIIHFRGWKILPLICYDLRFPVWSRQTTKEDYDLLIYVANWPERRNHAWKSLLPARAIENQSYVVGVNRIGNDGNEIYHSGDSVVLNYRGEVLSKTKAHENAVETVELNKEELIEHRKHFAFHNDADHFSL
jgi:predicted amidohydrolase